jgi:hypothetical protein
MTLQTVRHATACAAVAAFLSAGALDAHAQQCTTLTSDLRFPVGVAQSNLGNLLVSESGIRDVLHQGRISIIDPDGARRTLVDGLPSANSDVGDPAGPAGLLMRGRTLYVAMSIGNAILVKAGNPNARVGNPSPASRLHFSANAERTTLGFSLTAADHDALANGDKVTLSNGGGDKLTLELIANFPDYIPAPLPTAADNVRGSNPFDLALIGNRLYVTDGGRNLLWEADIHSGAFAPLATFGPIPNPMFPAVGPPTMDAVPTGIREFDGQLFVTLFRGVPFAAGTSVVERVDPETGAHAAFVSGLKTAIDVLPTKEDGEDTSLFVLQHSSGPAPFFAGPGTLTHIQSSGSTTLASCLSRPSSMVRDEKSGAFYVTEVITGRLVVVR